MAAQTGENGFHWVVNPFTPTDRFSSIQNSEWKSPIKLLNVKGLITNSAAKL